MEASSTRPPPLALRTRTLVGAAAGLLLGLLLLAPLLGPGVVLVRDMVFVPRLPLGDGLLGLDAVPRAVPSDLLVALASTVLPGGWLQDLVLLATVVGGAVGAARLAPVRTVPGALVAATVYGWSPYLHERLLLGQWALLVGWAVLPWAGRAALDLRQGVPGAAARTVACLAVASAGGASSGLLVALLVLPCALLPRRPGTLRRAGVVLGATAVLALPWLVPALLAPGGTAPGDPAGVAAFAADADTPLGVLGSLLTLGGVWAPAAVPPGRAAGVAASVLVLLLALAGLRRLGTALPSLLVASGAGLLLAVAGRVPGLADLLREVVTHVPGGGLLRDGQKWVAPLGVLTAVGAACGAEALRERLAGRRVAGAVVVLAALAPVAALPAAAWGEGGRLSSSRVPAVWLETAAAVDRHPSTGPVAVLPWTLYRRLGWAGGRTVLDPFPRLVARRSVVDDDLPLSTGQVGGEDPLAVPVDRSVDAVPQGAPLLPALREAGVALVVVERRTGGADTGVLARQTAGLELLQEDPELALYAVPGGGRQAPRSAYAPVLIGHLTALVLAAWAVAAQVGDARLRAGPRR